MDAMHLIQRPFAQHRSPLQHTNLRATGLIANRRGSHDIDEADIAVVTVAPAADAKKKLWRVRVVVAGEAGTAEQGRVMLVGECGRTEYEAVVLTLYTLG